MSSQSVSEEFDVVVIGGGPAGSTFSTLLHKKGWKVLMLEKDHHPRFHIGESLLPMTLPVLDELGVGEKIRNIGMMKYGAEFNSSSHPTNQRETFYFDFALDRNHPHAYEVRRSEFDEILFRNASEKGVDAREGVKVTSVDFVSGDEVRVTTKTEDGKDGEIKARFLVDASGRDTFLSRRLNLKKKSKEHNSAAVFGHFDNVVRRPGKDAGNISIYWFQHGWFWMIPLVDGIMSVGAVCYPEYLKTRDCSIEDFLWKTIKLVPDISERMKDSKMVGTANATGNFSYKSTQMYGNRNEPYLLIGDAYAFIDPVFSSGVHIALMGASKASETIDACLRQPERRMHLLRQYQKFVTKPLKRFSWLIHRFNNPVIHDLFMEPGNHFRVQEGVISLLAGDLYRDTPVSMPLTVFKFYYYLLFLIKLPVALATHRRRKRNIDLIFTGGSTPQDRLEEEKV